MARDSEVCYPFVLITCSNYQSSYEDSYSITDERDSRLFSHIVTVSLSLSHIAFWGTIDSFGSSGMSCYFNNRLGVDPARFGSFSMVSNPPTESSLLGHSSLDHNE